jgi:hypothetical protein
VTERKLAFNRVGKSVAIGILVLLGLAVGVIVAAFVFLTGFAPYGFMFVAWFLCVKLFALDTAPWDRTRVALSLLIAWAAYGILHTLAAGLAPWTMPDAIPAVATASLFLGYIAWRETEYIARRSPENDDSPTRGVITSGINGWRLLGGFLLAILLVVNVVSPAFYHFTPSYWHRVNFEWNMLTRTSD